MLLKELKVYILGSEDYANWLPAKVVFVDSVNEADLVFFTGGEDVDPSMYNEDTHPTTYSDIERDLYEKQVFELAQALNIPCIGVCRGNQFLTVMSGGRLVQHQPNPGTHLMKASSLNGSFEGEILVTSTHHQAAYPFDMNKEDYSIIGWTECMLNFHENGNQEEMSPEVECEVVYYPKTKCLGIQPHPEYMMNYDGSIETRFQDSIKWFRNLFIEFMNANSLKK